MRKYLAVFAVVAVILVLFPMGFGAVFSLAAMPKRVESIELYIESEGKSVIMPSEEYLRGCLFAQIPVDYEQEALNAQAVAAYTYALKLLENGKTLSDNTAECQPYFSEQQAREYYKDDYEKYLPAIEKAAEYGAAHAVTYENKLIYAVYHSVSTGRTNRAEYIWNVDFPYLEPVESPWDSGYVNFEATNEITTEQMRVYMLHYDRSLNMPVDYAMWFTNANVDEWGYTLSLDVGGRTLSGGDVWRILKLRSAAFTFDYNGSVFVVKTCGYGHGVGLSQYGANEMAKGGKTAEEILRYYYTGADVITL